VNAENSSNVPSVNEKPKLKEGSESLMWVDKYKPQTLKQIIGQNGDKSNAKKLLNWLQQWHKNVAAGKKPACMSSTFVVVH
jgi:replication factor C subunit 1